MKAFELKTLVTLLSTNRSAKGPGIDHIVETILAPYGMTEWKDENGRVIAYGLEVGTGSDTLFAAHLDTCEGWDGQLKRKIKIKTDAKGVMMAYSDGAHVLGADDGVGVALLLHMIDNEVPGYFLLHKYEECGGDSGRAMADNHPDFLRSFKRAVEIDRRGTTSIITEQMGGVCASDEFAEALAAQLSGDDYFFMPDPTGIFTDVACYRKLIPEVVNVSAGYTGEHGANENLNLSYVLFLADQLLTVDWESLPTVRDHTAPDPLPSWANWSGPTKTKSRKKSNITHPEMWFDIGDMDYSNIVKWIKNADPRDVADMLVDMYDELSCAALDDNRSHMGTTYEDDPYGWGSSEKLNVGMI